MAALVKGETVLVTGGTGWIGSHIVHEALSAGLNAKLAIRDEAKAKATVAALEKIHGSGRITTVVVKDFNKEGAYDEAIKGVQGVVHTASDTSFSSDPDVVIPAVLQGYNTLLDAADKEKSVRRLVLTSSSVAMGSGNPGGETTQHLDVHSWNEAAVEGSKTAPDGVNVYTASKVLSEQAAWDFVKTKKPSFTVTSINPSAVFGAPVPSLPAMSTGMWLIDAAQGKSSFLEHVTPIFHVDVDDVARLHVLALTRQDVGNERIAAFGTPFTYNDLIDTIKNIMPDALTPDKKQQWTVEDNTTVDVSRAKELLKDQGGLRDLEYSVRRNLQAAV